MSGGEERRIVPWRWCGLDSPASHYAAVLPPGPCDRRRLPRRDSDDPAKAQHICRCARRHGLGGNKRWPNLRGCHRRLAIGAAAPGGPLARRDGAEALDLPEVRQGVGGAVEGQR
jgi:hypothetical protein